MINFSISQIQALLSENTLQYILNKFISSVYLKIFLFLPF